MSKFLDSVGLKHLWAKILEKMPKKVSELENDAKYITLDQVPEGAAASSTVPLMDGTADAGKEAAFARGDHRHPSDTTKVDKVEGMGLSHNDFTDDAKAKLEGVAEGANKYVHPTHEAKASGLYKVTVDAEGHVSATEAVEKADITGLGIPAQDTTYEDATAAVHGLMSTADKAKLDGIAEGANKYELPVAGADLGGVKTTSKVADAAGYEAAPIIEGVVYYKNDNTEYDEATGSAHGLMSAADKTKLDAFGDASTYALKEDISAVYRVKGSVDTYAELPATGNKKGDVYNVRKGSGEGEEDGMNYVWDGTKWDALGTFIVYEGLSNDEIDAAIAEAEA